MLYVVQPGDTIRALSRRFGVEEEDIRSENPVVRPPLREDYVLFPGEILKIPVAPPPAIEPVIAPTVVLYIVQPGDTLSRIATRFRVDLRRILADNPHVRRTPDLIYPGQIIYINYAGLV